MESKTVNLIKGLAIVVGGLSLSNLLTLTVYPIFSAVGLIALIAIVLGLAVAYAGIQVTSLSLMTVVWIFWAKFIWLIVNLLYSILLSDLNAVRLTILLSQLIIMAYLVWVLRKLPHSAPPMPMN